MFDFSASDLKTGQAKWHKTIGTAKHLKPLNMCQIVKDFDMIQFLNFTLN